MYVVKALYDGENFKRGCMKGKMWMADNFNAPISYCAL
jgi:hypothetical protein